MKSRYNVVIEHINAAKGFAGARDVLRYASQAAFEADYNPAEHRDERVLARGVPDRIVTNYIVMAPVDVYIRRAIAMSTDKAGHFSKQQFRSQLSSVKAEITATRQMPPAQFERAKKEVLHALSSQRPRWLPTGFLAQYS